MTALLAPPARGDGGSPPPRPDAGATLHEPVMAAEVVRLLRPRPGGRYIDATLGTAGHALALLAAEPSARLLGIDRDEQALDAARARLASRGDAATLCHGRFDDLPAIAAACGIEQADGVLFDLGLSSLQIAAPGRGFSFLRDEPLDMRMDPEGEGPSAASIVNGYPERRLAALLREFGEERRSRAIARAVVASRPLRTTGDLVTAIEQAVRPGRGRPDHIHPATRTFQALRIAVNDELSLLDAALPGAHGLLAAGGRLVVLSYHSLEDRIVKRFLRREATGCLCPPRTPACLCGHVATLADLTRRPLRPGADEVARNPRSRSARLRAAERLPAPGGA